MFYRDWYVLGDYLDNNVSFERGGFIFQKDNDLLMGISQSEIESAASIIAKKAVGEEITVRQEKKRAHINSYVEEHAPWHLEILEDIDLSSISFNPSNEEIEFKLQKEKFNQEVSIKRAVNKLLADNNIENLKADVTEIARKISGTSKNDLVHYIALRRNVLDIFKKSLESSRKSV